VIRPSTVLRIYCAASFAVGLAVSVPLVMLIPSKELSLNSTAILLLCFNVLMVMLLPLVLDWSERKYFKARFVQLEELAKTNPQLKEALDEQCRKLSLPGLRLAAVDVPFADTFTYGLWRHNPRLVVPASWLQEPSDESKIMPSIEVELNRFAKRDVSFLFVAFWIAQVAFQFGLIKFFVH
jgi:hypothetical protein